MKTAFACSEPVRYKVEPKKKKKRKQRKDKTNQHCCGITRENKGHPNRTPIRSQASKAEKKSRAHG